MQTTSATIIHFFASLWLLFCRTNEAPRGNLLAPISIFLIFRCYFDAKFEWKQQLCSSIHQNIMSILIARMWIAFFCLNNDIHLIQYHDEEEKNIDWNVSICVEMPSEACAHVSAIFHLSTIVKSMMKIKESFHMSFVWQSEFSKEVEERRKCHNTAEHTAYVLPCMP